jgi:hypothetical protein
MKNLKSKIATVLGSALCFCGHHVQAQNIFVDLNTSGSAGTTTIAAPAGYSYSAAAPVSGTSWNTFGESSVVVPANSAAATYTLYNNSALVDSSGTIITPTLTISLTEPVMTTHANPSTATGENTIQPGGVMQGAWRNYNNSSGFYITYAIAGLSASTPFDLYVEGGTGTSGQGTQITLAAGNGGATGATTDATANYAGNYGSLFDSTDSGATFQLMSSGTTWLELTGTSDASGNFSFEQIGTGSQAYLNGFQLVASPVPEPSVFALAGLGMLGFGWMNRRLHR